MTKGPVPEGLEIVEVGDSRRYQPKMEVVRAVAWNLGGMIGRSSFDIKYLVAVTRGGLVLTDCVSRALGIKDIQTLAIEVYEENEDESIDAPEVPTGGVKVYRTPDLPEDGEGAVFVDDVLDTGTTMAYIGENWPKAARAAGYTKHPHKDTMDMVDFYGHYVGDIWIDFPWEVETQLRENLKNGNHPIIL